MMNETKNEMWTWFYCGSCGGRYNIEGPNGEKHPDDGGVK
jgi:hypothetical protein